jgi:BirA family biotin operon repressor/biotin-[acetyl-CoA-carboxylase] ligase
VSKIISLPQVAPTNTWAKENAASLINGDVVLTHCQTAGRGQRGNSWEAEPGKNLTFSLFLQPRHIAPANQFQISEAVALGVVAALRQHLASTVAPDDIKVKWPNDIYVGNKKIAGILIEHSLSGNTINHTVAGIGLNVNQRQFLSPAPNPVSMWQLVGTEFQLADVLQTVITEIQTRIDVADTLHPDFLAALWRFDGQLHPFATPPPDNKPFRAKIVGVDSSGLLNLELTNGNIGKYAFKEVSFIL